MHRIQGQDECEVLICVSLQLERVSSPSLEQDLIANASEGGVSM